MPKITKSPPPAEAAPAAPLGSPIPQEITAVQEVEAAHLALVARQEDTARLKQETEAAIHELLETVDLRDEAQLGRIGALQWRTKLIPARLKVLDQQVETSVRLVRKIKQAAAGLLRDLAQRTVFGNEEIAARAVLEHFDSIEDARQAVRGGKAAQSWIEIESRFYLVWDYFHLFTAAEAIALWEQLSAEEARLLLMLPEGIPGVKEMRGL